MVTCRCGHSKREHSLYRAKENWCAGKTGPNACLCMRYEALRPANGDAQEVAEHLDDVREGVN